VNRNYNEYYTGNKLFGDDFTLPEIEQWFADEAEGYANLGAKKRENYRYVYHQLNKHHLFQHLNKSTFTNVLGLGSAYGEELEPLASRAKHFTILDPSDAFADTTEILNTPCKYHKPNANGEMTFENDTFDLITCFGVLHHIPNVSTVLRECYRCLKPGGQMLIREPISSMGDWSKPRKGLTKRERGIPVAVFQNIIENTGFRVDKKAYSNFPILPKLAKKFGIVAYNNSVATWIDAILCLLTSWNITYHREKLHRKFAPGAINIVLKKP